MKIRGWVYVITNKAMPGLVKIGYSTKDPTLRAQELGHTGNPHPYVVEFDILVEKPRDIEQTIHSSMREQREGKEWFRCTVEEAIRVVNATAGAATILLSDAARHASDSASATQRTKEAVDRPQSSAEAVGCAWHTYGCDRPAHAKVGGHMFCKPHFEYLIGKGGKTHADRWDAARQLLQAEIQRNRDK